MQAEIQALLGEIEAWMVNHPDPIDDAIEAQWNDLKAHAEEAIELFEEGDDVEAAEAGAEVLAELTAFAAEMGIVAAA